MNIFPHQYCPDHGYKIIESENSVGWKGPLEVI